MNLSQALLEEQLPIHAVVNNAGSASLAKFVDTKLDDWDRIMTINAKTVLAVSQVAARDMKVCPPQVGRDTPMLRTNDVCRCRRLALRDALPLLRSRSRSRHSPSCSMHAHRSSSLSSSSAQQQQLRRSPRHKGKSSSSSSSFSSAAADSARKVTALMGVQVGVTLGMLAGTMLLVGAAAALPASPVGRVFHDAAAAIVEQAGSGGGGGGNAVKSTAFGSKGSDGAGPIAMVLALAAGFVAGGIGGGVWG